MCILLVVLPCCVRCACCRYRVRAACTRLGLPRLPLVQLHWDDWGSKGYVDVALHLADLQRRGLVGAVGVCNWDVPRLLELIDAGVTPVTNQVGLAGGTEVEEGVSPWFV